MRRTELYWKQEFTRQQGTIKALMLPGEKFVQCLDNKSFNGKYYHPMWVATSFGRVYSLASKKFLSIKPKAVGVRKKNGEYSGTSYYYIGGKICAHRLTANYFCDKRIIEKYGEDTIVVHHIQEFDVSKGLIENNHVSNLCYIPKQIHIAIINKIYDGIVPIEIGTDIAMLIPTFFYHDSKGIRYDVDENGAESISMQISLQGKFILPEEEILIHEYSLEHPNTNLVYARIVKRNSDSSLTIKFDNGKKYQYFVKTRIVTKI